MNEEFGLLFFVLLMVYIIYKNKIISLELFSPVVLLILYQYKNGDPKFKNIMFWVTILIVVMPIFIHWLVVLMTKVLEKLLNYLSGKIK